MKRRDFIKLTGGVSASLLAPEVLWAGQNGQPPQATAAPNTAQRRKLVLIRLKGGNDGLNTLIPLQQYPRYREFRPTLSMPDHLHQFKARELMGSGMALNPYLDKLQNWWGNGQGDIAWIQGVGYARPVLSHFESADVWDTAAPPGHSTTGWLAHILPRYQKDLHGMVLGSDELGPMSGKDCYAICMKSPEVFLSQMDLLDAPQTMTASNPALAHLANIQSQVVHASHELQQKMSHPRPLGGAFANSKFGRQLESVAKMIINGVDTAVYQVELDGFDTHSDQLNRQNHNLNYLADALDSFATAMKRHGHWDNVLVMTYSEFGRRVHENRGGTDHGAASVQLVMGGSVRGGIYGQNPDLNNLDSQGNLPMTTDFRQVYATVAQRWFRQPSPWAQYGTLPFV
ncbi:MAG: DUF1501 domain-containing protein [Thiolinea sp.]